MPGPHRKHSIRVEWANIRMVTRGKEVNPAYSKSILIFLTLRKRVSF